jgi:DNA-binding NarL/FixJ family response regulator
VTVRVALADDQALVRAGFRSLLANTADIELVGEASDGLAAIDMAHRARPDVLLMDIRMPELDGIEATRRICADPAMAPVRIIVLTTYELDEYVFAALRAGGDALLSPSVTRTLIAAFTTGPSPPADAAPKLATLTEREREVTALAAHGKTNAEIGHELFISPATAKTHLTRAMTKVHARDRAQLVVFAYQSGLVRQPHA